MSRLFMRNLYRAPSLALFYHKQNSIRNLSSEVRVGTCITGTVYVQSTIEGSGPAALSTENITIRIDVEGEMIAITSRRR